MSARVRVRPYRHVDAKWFSGLLLIGTLGAGFVLLALFRLTARGRPVARLQVPTRPHGAVGFRLGDGL